MEYKNKRSPGNNSQISGERGPGSKAVSLTDNRQLAVAQLKENHTGLPDHLKSGIEQLSGFSMDDVKVHYHSSRPATVQAHAYAQGTDIHIASGQEKYLPHEAWHVVQQKQGRVRPTIQLKGNVNVNNDIGLEKEADLMGAKSLTYEIKQDAETGLTFKERTPVQRYSAFVGAVVPSDVIQAKQFYEDIQNSGQDPAFYNHQLIPLNLAMKAAVDALRNNATTAQAQAAMQNVFITHHGRPVNHTLNFVGTSVFLRNAAGINVDRLGTLSDDQNPDMYLQVPAAAGDQNTLWVNKSSGEDYVRDTNNLFTPRFQSRSITVPDRARINAQNSVQGTHPGSNATPLQHVGGANSPYISMSAGLEDVTNAHGAFFNAANTGRITADMLQVPSANIVDLHATVGARAELGRHMAVNIRDNFPAIWDHAHTQVDAIHATSAAGQIAAHTVARNALPPTMNAGQTLQWQQLLDAVRTKEVLVHRDLPFSAITSFGNSGAYNIGAGAAGGIAANLANSQARTVASQAVLTAHQQPAALNPPMATELAARIQHARTSFYTAKMAQVGALAPTPNLIYPRIQDYDRAMRASVDSIETLAGLFQQRISGEVYGPPPGGIAAGVAAFQTQVNAQILADVAAV